MPLRPTLRCAWILSLVMGLWPVGRAHGQQQAWGLYHEATDLAEQGDYAAALARYRAVYALVEEPSLRQATCYGLGITADALVQANRAERETACEAVAWLECFLEQGAPPDAETTAAVERAQRRLRQACNTETEAEAEAETETEAEAETETETETEAETEAETETEAGTAPGPEPAAPGAGAPPAAPPSYALNPSDPPHPRRAARAGWGLTSALAVAGGVATFAVGYAIEANDVRDEALGTPARRHELRQMRVKLSVGYIVAGLGALSLVALGWRVLADDRRGTWSVSLAPDRLQLRGRW